MTRSTRRPRGPAVDAPLTRRLHQDTVIQQAILVRDARALLDAIPASGPLAACATPQRHCQWMRRGRELSSNR
jgi:hypothetical protein